MIPNRMVGICEDWVVAGVMVVDVVGFVCRMTVPPSFVIKTKPIEDCKSTTRMGESKMMVLTSAPPINIKFRGGGKGRIAGRSRG